MSPWPTLGLLIIVLMLVVQTHGLALLVLVPLGIRYGRRRWETRDRLRPKDRPRR